MSFSDMHLFNEQVQTVATETVADNVQLFNHASAGALVLGNQTHLGDYLEEASYQLISNVTSPRDVYAEADAEDTVLDQLLDRSVKIDRRIGPIAWTTEQFRRQNKSEEEAGIIIGEQAAKGMLKDYLNAAIRGLRTALSLSKGEETTSFTSEVDDSSPVLELLVNGASLLGDRSSALVAWVMHSRTYHALVKEAVTNTQQLFHIGDINVKEDGLGRRYIITDSPSLLAVKEAEDEATTILTNTYTLGLVSGAVQVQTDELHSVTADITGRTNLKKRWQGEYSFTLGLKGYSWAKPEVRSPDDDALSNAENWKQMASSIKDTAGIIIDKKSQT